jgi:anti-sigma factor RsiW
MKPQIDIHRINAFVDGELDLAAQLEMEECLQRDAGLREQVEALRRLREDIREGANYHPAPAALRRRIAMIAATKPAPQPPRPSAIAATAGRWFEWRPLVASFGLVAVLGVTLDVAWLRSSQDSRLLDDVVASHVRSTLGQHLVDVASSDRHTVKPWLSSKLDFSPPVNELQIPRSVFLGGRVDYLDGHPVAALVYRQGEHVVNSFVWPSAAPDSKAEFSAVRGFQAAHWSQGSMTHWVISDLNREEFSTVVGAIQQAGDGNR